jgi:hypothetical protein
MKKTIAEHICSRAVFGLYVRYYAIVSHIKTTKKSTNSNWRIPPANLLDNGRK